jgi:tetratricopeptide (TPR) repeat protein
MNALNLVRSTGAKGQAASVSIIISAQNPFLSRSTTMFKHLTLLFVSLLAIPAVAFAQETGPTPEANAVPANPGPANPVPANPGPANPGDLIKQAFEKTKTAATLEEFDEVIALCEGLKTAPLTVAQADYVKKLASWSLNRRGEMRSDLAAKAGEEGGNEEARELDRLALADFEMAIELDATRGKPFHNRGVSRALAGEFEAALADFNKAIAFNPGYANTWFNLGEVQYELGRLNEALRAYSEAIRLAPEDADAYTSRANTYFSLGAAQRDLARARQHFFDAITDFNQVVRLRGGNALAHANRGDAYRALRKWEWAADDYRRAIKLDDSLARAHAGLAWLMATCPEDEYRNVDEALSHAQRAIDLASSEERFLFEDALAAAQANAGRYDEAQATLAKAIEAAPEKEKAGLAERLVRYQNGQPYRQ